MTDKEKEELEFAHTEAANAIQRYFDVVQEKRGLQNKIVELGIEKDNAVSRAKLEMAKTIFKDMYDIISGECDETIVVTATDVKSIAKRYGVRL